MVIYKITNLITNKIYIGKDESNTSYYMGSGKYIKNSIKKHGIENFKKDIIEYCIDSKHLAIREIFWINELNSTNPLIGYNLTDGGNGGNTFKHKTEDELNAIKKKLSDVRKGKSSWNAGTKYMYTYEDMYGKEKAEALKKHRSLTSSKRRLSEITKENMSINRKGKRVGVKWINNGIITKQLNLKDEFPEGWNFGRLKLKKNK